MMPTAKTVSENNHEGQARLKIRIPVPAER
jgi:hypothetical protein